MAQVALLPLEPTPVEPPPTPGLTPAPGPTTGPPPPPAERPAPRLLLEPYDLAAALALREAVGIGPVLAQVLVRRGLAEPQAAREFLAAGERHDPAAITGIEAAVELIRRHIAAGSRIAVHGDYDVDGVCATAILVRGLRALGADARPFLPSRIDDGYGLTDATVDRLAASGTTLLVTVDCGITAVGPVARAQAAGLDVVVTDHHSPLADGTLPDCPIVHPGLGGYPCPELCGSAVAHKLTEALAAPGTEDDLELVALATVADLMPLRGENRRLVREGLNAMANTTRPGLRALMAVARTDPSALDASALGFRLAPRINATGRLRRPDAALELLLTADGERAREIALELDGLNAERRAVEQRIVWEAEQQVAELGERSAYVLYGPDWHPGVIGIVASRIVERYHRPALLIAGGAEESGGIAAPAQGSGRSIPGFDLLGGLHAVAGHLVRYGGHRAAAGLTILGSEIPALRAAFEAHAESVLTPEMLAPVQRVDAAVCGSELTLDLADELVALEPCGMGNPGVRVLVPGARFADARAMGEGKHVRFSVSSGGVRARAVAFGCDGRVPGAEGQPMDAVFTVSRNVWNGTVEAQLVLKDARPVAPDPITVLGGGQDYITQALAELDRPLDGEAETPGRDPEPARVRLDRRGRNPLAVLADARSAGGGVLAVCADVPRRLPGLAERAGGFTLTSYTALADDPALADPFAQIVALDPPGDPESAALLRRGRGFTHLAWGEPELRFVRQMHESRSELRTALGVLYRRLRDLPGASPAELEDVLRGDGRHPLAPAEAGRLVRVLAELGLVRVDRGRPALTVTEAARAALEDSTAYRAYARHHEDGRRWLNRSDLLPAA